MHKSPSYYTVGTKGRTYLRETKRKQKDFNQNAIKPQGLAQLLNLFVC